MAKLCRTWTLPRHGWTGLIPHRTEILPKLRRNYCTAIGLNTKFSRHFIPQNGKLCRSFAHQHTRNLATSSTSLLLDKSYLEPTELSREEVDEVDELSAELKCGNRAALAQAITLVQSRHPSKRAQVQLGFLLFFALLDF